MYIFTNLVVLVLAVLLAPAGWAADERPRYSLKQDEPNTGTNIKRSVAYGSVIPLDKRYGELSSEQQGYLRSQYESLGENDEPPFPVDGMGPITKAIVAGQGKFLVRGDINVAVDVNSQGEAVSVSVLKSPDAEMTKFVATILMLEKYKPARCNGTPCAMQFPLRFTFEKKL
jgi:hypothetical protein